MTSDRLRELDEIESERREVLVQAVVDLLATIDHFKAEWGDRAPIVRDTQGGYVLANLYGTLAALLQQQY